MKIELDINDELVGKLYNNFCDKRECFECCYSGENCYDRYVENSLRYDLKELFDSLVSKDNSKELNPKDVINELINNKAHLMATFGTTYLSYLKVLNSQVFNSNGYELIAKKIDK